MEKDEEKGKLDFTQEKIEASFKATEVGFRIVMFLKTFNSELIEKQTFKQLTDKLDKQFCQLGDKQEVHFREVLKQILDIKDYKQYYAFQGKPIKDDPTLKQMLLTALKNSAEKGYHGKEGDLNAIPTLSD